MGSELAERALKDLGPVVYNMYGSTEIAFATIAEPKHLEFNSSTVGPVVKGVKVKIFDDNGEELPQGEVGRTFVVKKGDADLDEDTVKHYVRDHLARYKVPREVVFLDELPRNPTGKVLKRELREMEID